MKTVTQRELAARSKAVPDDVEAGEIYRITRAGAEIAGIRPIDNRRRFVPVAELRRGWRGDPAVEAARMRAEAEADAFHGDEDRVGGAPRGHA
ncbi:type II toxin-antitoxin system Phd/YefM family antitoxin [Kitasatospora sp. NPDC096204]|uniref:type II toxin-antitoxin system Phd/YefM family antitoxin n=1 Tax=Kitasatospora sp. NPDC096204 TaxID=3364094 RepID=UPI00382AC286